MNSKENDHEVQRLLVPLPDLQSKAERGREVVALWHNRQPDPEKDKPTPLPARAERKTGREVKRDERANERKDQ